MSSLPRGGRELIPSRANQQKNTGIDADPTPKATPKYAKDKVQADEHIQYGARSENDTALRAGHRI